MANKKKTGLTAAQKRDLITLITSYEEVLKLNPSQFDDALHADNWKGITQYGGYKLMQLMDQYPLTLEVLRRMRKYNIEVKKIRKPNWICEIDGVSRFGGSRARSIKAIMSDPNLTPTQRIAEMEAISK
jgi:hypothetical protein